MEMQHQLLQHSGISNGDAALHNPFSYLVDFGHNTNSSCVVAGHLPIPQHTAAQTPDSLFLASEQFTGGRGAESEQASSALLDAHLPTTAAVAALDFGQTSSNAELDPTFMHLLRPPPHSSNKQGNRTGNCGRSADRKRPYPCTLCASKFGSKMELEEHQNSHTGLKPFQCEICQSRFNRRSTLWNHKRIHSDAKPFVCPVCQMTFKWKNSLKCHKEMHSRKNETGPIKTVIVHSESRILTYATAAKKRTGDAARGDNDKQVTTRKRAKQSKAAPKTAKRSDGVNGTQAPSVIYRHQSLSAPQGVKPCNRQKQSASMRAEIKCGPSLLPSVIPRAPDNSCLSTTALLQRTLVDQEPQLSGFVASNGGLDAAVGNDLMLTVGVPQHRLNNVALSYGGSDLFPHLDQYQFQSVNFPLLDIGLQQQLSALAATESLKRSTLPSHSSTAPSMLQQHSASALGSHYSSPVVAANAFESQGAFLTGDNGSPAATMQPTPTEMLLSSFQPASYQLESAALLSAVAAANHSADHQQQFGVGGAPQPHSLVDYLDYSQLHHSASAPQRSTPIYQNFPSDSRFAAPTSNHHQQQQHTTSHCGALASPRTGAFRPSNDRSGETMLSSLLNSGVGGQGFPQQASAHLSDHSPSMLHTGVFSRMGDTGCGIGSSGTTEPALLYRQP